MSKINKVKKIFLVIFLFPFLSGCAKEEKTKILIYSIPSKLRVYLAPLDSDKTSQNITDEGLVKIYNKSKTKHALIDDRNFKGTSPLVLNEMSAGHYILAVEPVEFFDNNVSFQNEDPFLKPIAYVSSFSMDDLGMMNKLRSGQIKQEGAVIYKFEKKEDKKAVIIIHAKENIALDELNSEYPKEPNFDFDRLKLDKELEEKNIKPLMTDNELETVLDLLERGGKAICQKGDIRVLIEILDEQKFKIEAYRKAKKS